MRHVLFIFVGLVLLFLLTISGFVIGLFTGMSPKHLKEWVNTVPLFTAPPPPLIPIRKGDMLLEPISVQGKELTCQPQIEHAENSNHIISTSPIIISLPNGQSDPFLTNGIVIQGSLRNSPKKISQ